MLSALSAIRPGTWLYPLLILEPPQTVLALRLRGASPIGYEEAHAYRPPDGNSREESLVSLHHRHHTIAAAFESHYHRWHAYRGRADSWSVARVALDGRQQRATIQLLPVPGPAMGAAGRAEAG